MKLICRYAKQIIWNNAVQIPQLAPGEVQVWRVKISADSTWLSFCKQILSDDEQKQSSRYRKYNDEIRYINSHAALRLILSRHLNVAADRLEFNTGMHGKPHMVPSCGVSCHFNISHSGNYSLIAVSQKPVGVDVEFINTGFAYQDVLSYAFNPDEVAYIGTGTDARERFYDCWTRKEALLKALSIGLRDDMKLISCLNGEHNLTPLPDTDNWAVHAFSVDQQYAGSVAAIAGSDALNFYNFDTHAYSPRWQANGHTV